MESASGGSAVAAVLGDATKRAIAIRAAAYAPLQSKRISREREGDATPTHYFSPADI